MLIRAKMLVPQVDRFELNVADEADYCPSSRVCKMRMGEATSLPLIS